MKSAGNGGVVQSRLQVLHVHVFLAAQLGARRVAKSGADQHQGGVPVRECPHHTGAAADLTVQPLDHVVGTDAGPMLAGKIAVGQRFLCTIFSDIVCCLLSEWCVVTSFYQSLQAMSSFMRFSICATYCTLSYESGRIAWIYGETKLSGKINIQRSCFSSYYCSSTAQLCGKLHGVFALIEYLCETQINERIVIKRKTSDNIYGNVIIKN